MPAEQLICAAGVHPSIVAGESGAGKDPIGLSAKSNCPWMFFPCGDPNAGGMSEGPEYDVGGKLFEALEAKFPGNNRTRRFREMNHGFVTRGSISGDKGQETAVAIREVVQELEA